MRKSLLPLILSLVCVAAEAQPFRTLPPFGERGVTGEQLTMPAVAIGRRVLRLAPGAVIFDQNNRTLVHAQLPVGAHVFFTRNGDGDIQRLYVVTDDEWARLRANPPPRRPPPGFPAAQPPIR